MGVAFQSVEAINLTTGLEDAGGSEGAGYDTDMDVTAVIGLIIQVVIGFLGVIFLVLTIYAGVTWMTAAGDAKKVDKAKGTLTTAVIGLVIVLAAYSITSFVLDQLIYATDGTSGVISTD
jgi:tetrahydromethanopterin S-methyltransferase subunit G